MSTLRNPLALIDHNDVVAYQGRSDQFRMSWLITRMLILIMSAGLFTACTRSSQAPVSPRATPEPPATPTNSPTPTLVPTATLTPTPRPEARLFSGSRALFYGDWDLAQQEYQTTIAEAVDPNQQAEADFGIARVHYLRNDYPLVLNHLRDWINTYPEAPQLPDALFTLAETYRQLDRHQEAAEAYQAYLFTRPGLIDYYVQEMRGDALTSAGDLQGAIEAYQAALQAPHLGDGLDLRLKIGQTYAALGDFQAALAIYDEIYALASSDFTRARLDLLSGQAYAWLDDMEQAYAAYLHAVENYPLSYDAYLALVALVEAGIPVDEFQRGLVDYHAGQYGVAISAFDRFLNTAEDNRAAAAYYYKGRAYQALQDSQTALNQWERVIQNYPGDAFWDDAWEFKADTLWRDLDQFPEAIATLLSFVDTVPQDPRAAEFLFDAARISERSGDLPQAARLWDRVASEYAASDYAFKGAFLAGITRYRIGDFAGARDAFQRSLGLALAPADVAASHLWIGKSEAALGDLDAARGAWDRAAIADPTGYYSERGRDLLLGREPFSPPQAYDLAVDQEAERVQAEEWLVSTFGLPEGIDLSNSGSLLEDPRVQRGAELWRLGLYEQARLEFEDLRMSLQNDPANLYRLANYLVDLGLYRTAIYAARQVLSLAGMDDAGTMSAPPYFNHLRFGSYFSELVLPVAEAYDFHPLFIYSLIRQESLFEGFVRSSAGARGLMQIIPSTGQAIYELNGWPPDYTADDLYRPKVSVTLGVDYLSDQRNAFDGDLVAALAAYNGGPGNARVWKNLAPDDSDLFLEVVRFDETQRYIRGIYEIFSIYRRLYDRTP